MTTPLKIGIIGTGGIARAHARSYKQLSDVEIVAVCDVIPGRAKAFAEAEGFPGARAYEDHRQMLEKESLDGVSICSPNNSHHYLSIDALDAGVNVITEKPMAVTLEQAINMERAAKRSGKILTIGFQPRYDPNMQTIKNLVQSGILGKVYYVETGGGRRRGMPGGTFIKKELAGAGAMADIGCYSLDMALNALGYPKPLTVSALTGNYFGKSTKYNGGWHPDEFEVEDFGAALIRLEGDIALYFKISWAMHMDTLGATFFLGSEAGLKCTSPNGVWDGGVASISIFHDLEGHQTESPIPVKRHDKQVFFEKIRGFVEAVKNGDPAPIPGSQIVRNQAIIDGVLRSAEAGREVEIEIPEI